MQNVYIGLCKAEPYCSVINLEHNVLKLLYFSGNIPGNDIAKGEEIMNYIQPFPPKGIGSQRLVFILYKQEKVLDFTSFREDSPW